MGKIDSADNRSTGHRDSREIRSRTFQFKNNNELVFSVDLEKPATISKVIFGTLYNPAFRVLPASAARVEVSTNGKEFKEVRSESVV